MEPRTPRFSGALGPAAIAVPLAILVLVPALAWAYVGVDVNSPLVGWTSLALVLAFGYALGWVVAKVGVLARCRDPRFLEWMGVLAGLAGVYCAWAWFVRELLARGGGRADVVDLLAHPHAMWAFARALAEEGWYTIHGVAPDGAALWASWAIELVLVVALARWKARSALDERVFCERCGRWCEADGAPRLLAVPAGKARARVRAGELEAIVALAGDVPDENDHVELDVRRCSQCKENGAFRLRRVASVPDEERRRSLPFEALIDGFLRKRGAKQHVEVLLDYVPVSGDELVRLSALRHG